VGENYLTCNEVMFVRECVFKRITLLRLCILSLYYIAFLEYERGSDIISLINQYTIYALLWIVYDVIQDIFGRCTYSYDCLECLLPIKRAVFSGKLILVGQVDFAILLPDGQVEIFKLFYP
jgi:hypothetical protein